MFRFFESLVNPYPEGEPEVPPRGLLPFILHFSRPVLPLLIAMSLVTALVSAAEVLFFHYMGELVDWLAGAEREGFFADYGWRLAGRAWPSIRTSSPGASPRRSCRRPWRSARR